MSRVRTAVESVARRSAGLFLAEHVSAEHRAAAVNRGREAYVRGDPCPPRGGAEAEGWERAAYVDAPYRGRALFRLGAPCPGRRTAIDRRVREGWIREQRAHRIRHRRESDVDTDVYVNR